jgi:hypothetical protein
MNVVTKNRYFNERGKRNAFNKEIIESYASFNTNRSHATSNPKLQSNRLELNTSRARLTELSPLKHAKQQSSEFVPNQSVDGIPYARKSVTTENMNSEKLQPNKQIESRKGSKFLTQLGNDKVALGKMEKRQTSSRNSPLKLVLSNVFEEDETPMVVQN